MKDFCSKKRVVATCVERSDLDAEFSEHISLGLRLLLDKELDQDAEARKQRKRMLDKREPMEARTSNREWLQLTEHGMQAVRSHGFEIFRPSRVVNALKEAERLYFAMVPTRSGEKRKRACIVNRNTGERWLALLENEDELGGVECPVWHVVVDVAPVGLPGLQWSKNGLSLRMIAMPDRLHQLMRCWLGVVSDACLMLRRMEAHAHA